MNDLRPPLPLLYEPIVEAALREDLGRAGDQTTDAVVPADATATARLVARRAGRVAGLSVACRAFTLLDPRVEVDRRAEDGEDVAAGAALALISGPARPILSAERVALNLLGRLCGIATATREVVAAVAGTGARVACTRKTTPGLRLLEKYAVRAGGGANHRFGLDDAVLIKDNHKRLAGGITAAVRKALAGAHGLSVEVEVETLAELDEAMSAGATAVLLDNFTTHDMRQAVARVGGQVRLEISGGVTLERLPEIASTGADAVSIGALTHSAPAVDLSFELEPAGP